MMFLQRIVRAKYVAEERHKPEGIQADKWMPVVGFEVRSVKKNFGNQEKYPGMKEFNELYLLVIGTDYKIHPVPAFNCNVILSPQDGGVKAADLLEKATNIIQRLTEMISDLDKKYK